MTDILAMGLVRRYHTVPDEGRGQTVAEHSWGVAILIATYHPSPSPNLLKAALNHDLPEHLTGDLPATAKWNYPALKKAVQNAEKSIRVDFGWEVELTEREQYWLQACDMLECLHYVERRTVHDDDEWANIAVRARTYIGKMRKDGTWPKELD